MASDALAGADVGSKLTDYRLYLARWIGAHVWTPLALCCFSALTTYCDTSEPTTPNLIANMLTVERRQKHTVRKDAAETRTLAAVARAATRRSMKMHSTLKRRKTAKKQKGPTLNPLHKRRCQPRSLSHKTPKERPQPMPNIPRQCTSEDNECGVKLYIASAPPQLEILRHSFFGRHSTFLFLVHLPPIGLSVITILHEVHVIYEQYGLLS